MALILNKKAPHIQEKRHYIGCKLWKSIPANERHLSWKKNDFLFIENENLNPSNEMNIP